MTIAIPGMPRTEYLARPGINASALKAGNISMLHMHARMTGPVPAPTPSMRRGTHIHAALLDRTEFARLAWIYDGTRRGKAWDAACNGRDPEWSMRSHEHAALLAVSEAVYTHADAGPRLHTATDREVSLFWDEPDIGPCKARLDALTPDREPIELKTTGRTGLRGFARTAGSHGYILQLGWYARAAAAVYDLPSVPVPCIIALEQRRPYDVAVFRPAPMDIERAIQRCLDLATEYRECARAGVYPGAYPETTTLELPPWTWETTATDDGLDWTGTEEDAADAETA